MSLVSMLKDHMTLLKLLPFHYLFLMSHLTIVKIGDSTNILYQPCCHADSHVNVINPTDTSCLHFPIAFTVLHAQIRQSLWQPHFHAGILAQEIRYALFAIGIDLDGVHIQYCSLYFQNYHCAKFGFTRNCKILVKLCTILLDQWLFSM